MTADEKKSKNTFEKISHGLHTFGAKSYYKLGLYISDHPLVFLIVPVLLALACMAGFTTLDPEADPEKLYTPQNSVGFDQRLIVEEIFGFDDRRNFIYYTAPTADGNILTKDAMLDLMEAYEIINSTVFIYEEGTDDEEIKTLQSGCVASSDDICDFVSPLDFWDYNRTALEEDTDILATINSKLAANATDRLRRPLEASDVFGGIVRNNVDEIIEAYVTRFSFLMSNNVVDLEGESDDDPATRDWEKEISQKLRDKTFNNFIVYPLTLGDADDASSEAITGDIILLPIGYVLLSIYASCVFSRRNSSGSYAGMALISILAIGLAIAGCFAFGTAVGVQFSLAVQALAFLLLGLGIDDTFVIMSAYRSTPYELSTKQRIGRALSSAGVSITVTSVTDMVAFFSGAATSLPAITSFCLYAAIGVLFDFLLQITFFVAALYFYGEREKNGRADVICCYKLKHPDKKNCRQEEYDHDSQNIIKKFMGDVLPKYILHPAGKAIIIVMALGLASVALFGATEVKFNFEIEYFIPDGHHTKDATQIRDQYFQVGRPVFFGVYMQDIDYPSLQSELDSLTTQLDNNEWVQIQISWWKDFKVYFQQTHNVTVAPSNDFYQWLDDFLQTPQGAVYFERVKFNQNKTSLLGTEILCGFVPVPGGVDKVSAMQSVREVANESEDLEAFAYNFVFLFWDGLAVIRWETLRNIIIAGSAVLVLTFLLLANIRASLTVFLMLVLVDINVLGVLYYADYEFNSVTAVNMVIAVGLAIDSSVHMCHAFLVAQGTKNERAAIALKTMGESVLNGTVSTFLALLPLAFAQSYIFQVYFALLASIIGFGIFHGAFVLPVVLSFIGPPSYPPVEIDGEVVNSHAIEHSNSKSTKDEKTVVTTL